MRVTKKFVLVRVVIALICVLFIWIFTPAVIIPPSAPAHAIAVHVLDLGLHSELVLPNGKGKLILYAYGDWNYFALNQKEFSDGLAALLIPTQGTLGRRQFTNIDQLRQMVEQRNLTLLTLKVEQTKVIQLAQSLEERFTSNIDTRITNPRTGLILVQDEQDYTILHNSNHELIDWLEKLDCQVKGFVIWANFRVQHP
jgi:hypothetical protein